VAKKLGQTQFPEHVSGITKQSGRLIIDLARFSSPFSINLQNRGQKMRHALLLPIIFANNTAQKQAFRLFAGKRGIQN